MIIFALCRAGLGHRICTLLGATFLAKKLNAELHVSWVPTEICDCNYYDIFEYNNELIYNKTLFNDHNYFLNLHHNNKFDVSIVPRFFWSDTVNFDVLGPHMVDIDILHQYKYVLYQSNKILPCMSQSDIIDALSVHLLKNDIINTAFDFISANNISTKVNGHHVRLTDSFENMNRSNAPGIIEEIQHTPYLRYFVCSCDESFENEISKHPNAVVRKKTSYPQFITSSDTLNNHPKKERIIACNTELKYPYNYVDTQAVIDAFVDILILSRTNIIQQYPLYSNFRDLAVYYSYVYFGKTFLKYNNKIFKIKL